MLPTVSVGLWPLHYLHEIAFFDLVAQIVASFDLFQFASRSRCWYESDARYGLGLCKNNDLIIVSKNADMHDLSLVFGNPPKVIYGWQLLDIQIEKRCVGILTR